MPDRFQLKKLDDFLYFHKLDGSGLINRLEEINIDYKALDDSLIPVPKLSYSPHLTFPFEIYVGDSKACRLLVSKIRDETEPVVINNKGEIFHFILSDKPSHDGNTYKVVILQKGDTDRVEDGYINIVSSAEKVIVGVIFFIPKHKNKDGEEINDTFTVLNCTLDDKNIISVRELVEKGTELLEEVLEYRKKAIEEYEGKSQEAAKVKEEPSSKMEINEAPRVYTHGIFKDNGAKSAEAPLSGAKVGKTSEDLTISKIFSQFLQTFQSLTVKNNIHPDISLQDKSVRQKDHEIQKLRDLILDYKKDIGKLQDLHQHYRRQSADEVNSYCSNIKKQVGKIRVLEKELTPKSFQIASIAEEKNLHQKSALELQRKLDETVFHYEEKIKSDTEHFRNQLKEKEIYLSLSNDKLHEEDVHKSALITAIKKLQEKTDNQEKNLHILEQKLSQKDGEFTNYKSQQDQRIQIFDKDREFLKISLQDTTIQLEQLQEKYQNEQERFIEHARILTDKEEETLQSKNLISKNQAQINDLSSSLEQIRKDFEQKKNDLQVTSEEKNQLLSNSRILDDKLKETTVLAEEKIKVETEAIRTKLKQKESYIEVLNEKVSSLLKESEKYQLRTDDLSRLVQVQDEKIKISEEESGKFSLQKENYESEVQKLKNQIEENRLLQEEIISTETQSIRQQLKEKEIYSSLLLEKMENESAIRTRLVKQTDELKNSLRTTIDESITGKKQLEEQFQSKYQHQAIKLLENKSKIDELSAQNININKQLDDKDALLISLKESLEAVKISVDGKNQKINALKDEVSQKNMLMQKYDTLKEKSYEMDLQLKKVTEILDQQKQQSDLDKKRSEKERSELEAIHITALNENKLITKEFSEKDKLLASLKVTIVMLNTTVAERKNQVESMNKELSEAKLLISDYHLLREKHKEAEYKTDKLTDLVRRLEEQLRTVSEEQLQTRSEKDKISKSYQENIDALNEKLKKLQEDRMTVDYQLSREQVNRIDLESKITDFQKIVEDLHLTNKTLQAKLDNSEKEKEIIKIRFQELQKQLDLSYESISQMAS